ncbi:hypothetical protein [Yinghuangia sp. YIM S09857]|uniref:hypothetical protein n=1 Tax=Yinghuangia sp. YIM S09857 TaxID=3436929 RepID=UPI003F5333C2
MVMPGLSVTFIGLLVAVVAIGARAAWTRRRSGPLVDRRPGVAVGAVVGAWAGFLAGAVVGVVVDVTTGGGTFVAVFGHAVAVVGAVAGALRVLDSAPRRV